MKKLIWVHLGLILSAALLLEAQGIGGKAGIGGKGGIGGGTTSGGGGGVFASICSTSNAGSGLTSQNCTGTIAANTLIVVTTQYTGCTDTLGLTYTQDLGAGALSIYHANSSSSSGSDTITCTGGGSLTFAILYAGSYTGMVGTTDGTPAGNTATSTNPELGGAVTTTHAADICMGIADQAAAPATLTPSGGWNSRFTNANTAAVYIDQTESSTGTYTASWANSSTGHSASALTACYKISP
jgi:hypothetical protein